MKRTRDMSDMRIALSTAAFLAFTAACAQAEPVSAVSVTYNIDVGPMTMTVVKYGLKLSEGALRSQAQIKSHGISRVFSEYSAKAEAESLHSAAAIAPVRFRLVRESDERKKETSLSWRNGGGIDYAPQEKRAERRARIDNALTEEVADPMTAVLRIGTTGQTPCPSVQQIFDGRDVYELSLSDKGAGELKGDEGYRGPVQHCEVSWTPIAGRAAEKNEPRESYDVSFAPIGELPSGRTLWLPVALAGKLKGLPFKAYVTRLKSEGQAGSAASNQN
jgi:hypothetical protein